METEFNQLLNEKNHTKIDFHNHSVFSDGDWDIYKICELKQFLDVLCITDHFPDCPLSFQKGKEFEKRYRDDKPEKFPKLIIGMEYRLENNNELLIFGEDAIKKVIQFVPKNDIDLFKILHDYPSLSIVCHPIIWEKNCTDFVLEHISGIEITRSGMFLDEHEEKINHLKNISNLKFVSNSDFHTLRFPIEDNKIEYHTFNVLKNERIQNEQDLISAFSRDKKLEVINHFLKYPKGLLKNYWLGVLGKL